MLLESSRSIRQSSIENEPEFYKALGIKEAEITLNLDTRQRGLQVAVDALALRHQAAEALTRFIYALTAAKPHAGDAESVWLAISDSPTQMINVVKANRSAFNSDPGQFLKLLFPPELDGQMDVLGAADTALAWRKHAEQLLTDDELSVNAANNKLKHGLATSARDDVRIDFINTPPTSDGTIPLSAFGEGNSVQIFDRPMLTYLCRPPRRMKQGLEMISLRVEVPVVLAETWMIANVYAAMFHVAALKHFGGHLPEGIAPYPAMVVGRLPEDVIGGRVLGYRSAVTLPPNESTQPRPSALFFHRKFLHMDLDYASRADCVVVTD